MNQPNCLREVGGEVHLSIKVQPRASKNEMGGMLGNELKVKVTAPPVDSAANEAVVLFIAGKLNCPRRQISLLRGQTSQHKTILIQGVAMEDVAIRLGL